MGVVADAEPMVRILLPPAESQSLSRIRFRGSRTPAFRAGVRGWLGDRVSRDAPGFPLRANRRQYLCRAIFQYRGAADGVWENAALNPTKLGLHWAYISCAVDLSIRMELRQGRAGSADRARQAADGSARGASPP